MGCGSIGIAIGTPPRIDALESSLAPGRSTAEDVVRVLGLPSGVGRSQLPIEPEPRPMWSYAFEASTHTGLGASSVERTLLFVYFRDGRYDGYLWFSSVAARSSGG